MALYDDNARLNLRRGNVLEIPADAIESVERNSAYGIPMVLPGRLRYNILDTVDGGLHSPEEEWYMAAPDSCVYAPVLLRVCLDRCTVKLICPGMETVTLHLSKTWRDTI